MTGTSRARASSVGSLQRIAACEAGAVAVAGSAAGIAIAALVGHVEFGSASFGSTPANALTVALLAAAVGIAISILAVAIPATRDARSLTVAGARRSVSGAASPSLWWWVVAAVFLALAALVFVFTTRRGYSLVVAPEGVPSVTVDYRALAGPLLLWVGGGILGWRIVESALRRRSRLIGWSLRPVTGSLETPIRSTLRRQRRQLAGAVSLVALTVAFAISTSVFSSTYERQVRADAFLTNGADVTVTQAPTTRAAIDPATLAKVAGVRHVEPVAHRVVYVGADLQDLYGVDATTILPATNLQNAYFAGGSASTLMHELARTPDAALVSSETVKDFQLTKGDALHLRVRAANGGALRDVTFHYVGIVKEFPTAPRDSFIVANRSYLTSATGDSIANLLLVSTHNASRRSVAQALRAAIGPGPTISDLDTARRVVGSSLTAVDLRSLARVELAFALALAIAAGGLVLALGLAERRRSFAIASALGARPRQLGAFVHSEALVIAVGGAVCGAVIGGALSWMLVRVLTGVFDPPPDRLAVPWPYLAILATVTLAAIATASGLTVRAARKPSTQVLREL